MRLQVDLNGILLQLNIHDYQPSTDDAWFCEWCRTDFSFSSKSWLNYHKEDDEILKTYVYYVLTIYLYKYKKMCTNCINPYTNDKIYFSYYSLLQFDLLYAVSLDWIHAAKFTVAALFP